jgi:hypothetical protein
MILNLISIIHVKLLRFVVDFLYLIILGKSQNDKSIFDHLILYVMSNVQKTEIGYPSISNSRSKVKYCGITS